MCRNIQHELRDADGEATGSIRTAEAQRAEHKRLYEAVRAASRQPVWSIYQAAVDAWDEHIAGHKATADRIRAERAK